MALSREQQKLVEDNHNLIYAFLLKHKLHVEEYYGIAAIGLCKAASGYNPEKGTEFSTYAYRCMETTVYQTYRLASAEKRTDPGLVSLSLEIAEDLTLEDALEDYDSNPDERTSYIALLEVIASLPDRYRIPIELTVAGYNQFEIADIMHTNQVQVSRNLKKARAAIELKLSMRN